MPPSPLWASAVEVANPTAPAAMDSRTSSVAVALGWQPVGGAGSLVGGLVALLLASTAFAGIGLVLAGRLRAEINLAASNGLYIVLLLTSGFIVPLESFPTWMRSVVELLPSGALTSVLHSTSVRADVPVGSFIALLAWAVVTPLLAAKTFRFD